MKKELREYILNKKYFKFRKSSRVDFASEFREKGLSDRERVAERFSRICELEIPILMPDEQIVLTRSITDGNAIFIKEEGKSRIDLPSIFMKEELLEIKSQHFVHEAGYLSNVIPDFELILKKGLLWFRERADASAQKMIDALLDLCDRYAQAAMNEGKTEIVEVLKQVPRYPASNFHEALQFIRIINFAAWLEGNYHVSMGRFDLYAYPYLKKDLDNGYLDRKKALSLMCDFMLAFNKDTDLYFSIYRGDNGQSFTLGGVDKDNQPVFNELSHLCLEASRELKVIDPKINIRVNKDTPLEVYELGSELTAVGLGFPQYTNDDVIIPGLIDLGYEPEDARNYAIAACWEIIVPIVGTDIINIGALSFAKIIDKSFHQDLLKSDTFEEFIISVKNEIGRECDALTEKMRSVYFIPSPFYGMFFPFKELSEGGKYNNFGIHGTGLATAVDSLAAIKKYVYEEKTITPQEYISAVDRDFDGDDELLHALRYQAPKMGNNNDKTDELAIWLLDTFADALQGKTNARGGCYRPGTGSAMYYLWHTEEIGASPDGRRKGEGLGTNYSPSLFVKTKGPFSVISSFSKPNLKRTVNGGPLTLEIHSSVFKNTVGNEKLARLVKAFIEKGGHQIQLNVVDVETLLDAQKNPEKYPQLIVRIWGWSAYFIELDKAFQDHIIARTSYQL